MGKFVNTTHKQTIDSIVSNMQDIIRNPYYKWQNKTPTIVTYFNHNVEESTLDEGSKLEQLPYGFNSPTKYNKINDFYIYGMEQVQVQVENGDFGAEASAINGEAVILPNTITPYQGDYFIVNYTKDNIVFQVTGVSHDTLENGANIYKITYELDNIEKEELESNIAKSYQMMINNDGTKFNTIIRSEKYDYIKKLDAIRSYLREYFIDLFYSQRIQSFSYLFNMRRFYDPYMIEFIKNNDILKDNDQYIYIDHQLEPGRGFALDYAKTIFKAFEEEDFENIGMYKYKAIGRIIESKTNIFSSRPEQYWKVDFKFLKLEEEIFTAIPCFMDEFINALFDEYYCIEDSKKIGIYNVILKYVRGVNITEEDIEYLQFLDYQNNPIMFYAIPLIIFCIDRMVTKNMLKDGK